MHDHNYDSLPLKDKRGKETHEWNCGSCFGIKTFEKRKAFATSFMPFHTKILS